MSTIIDRRRNGKGKSTGNRQKFIRRAHGAIKEAVKEAIEKRNVSDIGSGDDNKNTITIPSKNITEPHFRHGRGGDKTYVLPGNKDKQVGDFVPKPKKNSGDGGTEGSPDGDGEDEFAFTLTREEFLEFFFEDLELPDLVKTQLKEVNDFKSVRAGYTTVGMPVNLNIIRSMRNATGRQIALQSPYKKELAKFEEELKNTEDKKRIDDLKLKIIELKKKILSIPFIDDIDIRYNSFETRPNPSAQAVMFCIMDVSGSMGKYEKDLSKRFFMLLYIFLQKHYQKIDVVFIRHHSTASECTEEEFFYNKDTGGTKVSTALECMSEIIQSRYNSSDWNIYGAQSSDGDNWVDDDDKCSRLMDDKIMPFVQYFAYVQIGRDENYSDMWMSAQNIWNSGDKPLWNTYKNITSKYKNFVMDQIDTPKDIYPVFKELFKKKE